MKKKALILSGITWNTTVQRHHAIARHLVKNGYEVHFVQGIISSAFNLKKFFHKLFGLLSKRSDAPRIPLDDGVTLIRSPFVNPQGGIFHAFNAFRLKKFLQIIDNEYDLVINYLPISTTNEVIKEIDYTTLIYDCVRDFSNWGGYPQNLPKIEHDLILNSDAVLVDSYYLYDKLSGRYPDVKIVQILPMLKEGQADIFKRGKPPKAIKNIAYIGQISSHIDLSVLEALVTVKQVTFHLFGSSNLKLDFDFINHGFMTDPKELAREVLKHVDAIIIPYKGNMDGVIPAKLFECLATSLPVFVSDFYDARKLSRMLRVYTSTGELLSQIDAYTEMDQITRNDKSKAYLGNHAAKKELETFDALISEEQRAVS